MIPAYVAAYGLTNLAHYHTGKSECGNQYSLTGLPASFIVDSKGMIVFKGHPAVRDLAKDFDTLLAGGAIYGNGTEAKSDKNCKNGCFGGGAAAVQDLDPATVMKEIDSFKEVAKELQASLKEHAGKMTNC